MLKGDCMTLTMKKLGAALVAAALALCIAPIVSMMAPAQAHAAGKTSIVKLYRDGNLTIDIATTKVVKQEQWNGEHNASTTGYTGKQVKPKISVRQYDESGSWTMTTQEYDPETDKIVTNKVSTPLRPLKAVNITGKSKKAAAKLVKQKKADVTIEYKNNVKVGTATVVVKGVNKYKGTLYRSFNIEAPQVKTVKVKAAKKALTVSWKKVKAATGYQIIVRDPVTSAEVKTVCVSAKKKSVKITGLYAKYPYEVGVRAYVSNVSTSYKYSGLTSYQLSEDDYQTVVYNGSYEDNDTFWGATSLAKFKYTK